MESEAVNHTTNIDIEDLGKFTKDLSNKIETDIYYYNGPIRSPYDMLLLDHCNKTKLRENALFILCTYGGEPDVGYKIARCLQRKYKKISVLIDGPCKSAGTLIAVGAHEIIMSDFGEIGPLDVQISKKDELWETDSGLTILNAIKALEDKSFELFENCFLNLKNKSRDRITLKTATKLACKLAVGTVQPIVSQIDPLHVGEVTRAMNIGLEYGARLAEHSQNAFENTLIKLANNYPSHSFVIDREEAAKLFANVRELNDDELKLTKLLGYGGKMVSSKPDDVEFIVMSNENDEEKNNESDNSKNDPEGTQFNREAISADQNICSTEENKLNKSESKKIVNVRK